MRLVFSARRTGCPSPSSLLRPSRRALALALLAFLALAAPARAQIDDACLWDNGDPNAPALFDGQLSMLGGGVPFGAKAADDFTLDEGSIHTIESVSVVMSTNALPGLEKAKVEIYSDCNGCPDRLLRKFTVHHTETLGALADGYRIVRFTFVIAEQPTDDGSLSELILPGGTYWITGVGRTDGNDQTLAYFGTSREPVKGHTPKKILGAPSMDPAEFFFPGPWLDTAECCIGCTDLSFRVRGRSCKVLYASGPADLSSPGGIVSEFSEGVRDSRGAGDFAISPCHTVRVCYIEGCIYTNCVGFSAIAEIYANACHTPAGSPGRSALFTAKATSIEPLDSTVVISGTRLSAYRVRFNLFNDGSIVLPGGGYWLSIAVYDTFSNGERALFCFSSRCRPACQVDFNPAAAADALSLASGGTWSSLPGREVSFLIAGERIDRMYTSGQGGDSPTGGNSGGSGTGSGGNGGGDGGAACIADFNRDGRLWVDDIFDYLDAWFQGCP